jgi:RNA polymerase sigma-54 factor
MKQSLELRLGQRLAMTPQLQQSIKLLQLSAIDLKTEIQQALEENPLLEEPDVTLEFGLDLKNESTEAPVPQEQSADSATAGEDAPGLPADGNAGVGEELEIGEWSAHFESHITGIRNDGNVYDYEDRSSNPTTLKEHLLWQMCTIPFSDTDRKIAISLIDAIDEDGYLQATTEEIVATLGKEGIDIENDEVEATLHQIQNFDPTGVGARDLKECLLIQLREFDQNLDQVRHARVLISEHFDLLCNRSMPQIKRLMKLDDATLNQAIKFIQGLYPRPGNALSPAQTQYVVPDIMVKKLKGEWRAEVNREAFPQLRISNAYRSVLGKSKGGEDKKYVQDHVQQARWFIKSLEQRNETLLKVANSIIERQREFFEHGAQAMQPMVLHDIANALNLHESTISRATTQKYMLTPRGIFELKYFFSSHVSTADGGTCSSTAIRTMIRQFVEREPATKPVSDSKMAKLLGQQGINVARRTIAKYREGMNIPASSQRKTIV